jgi:hypothetical protein
MLARLTHGRFYYGWVIVVGTPVQRRVQNEALLDCMNRYVLRVASSAR